MEEIQILKIAEESGIKVKLGETYSVKCQVAQLIEFANNISDQVQAEVKPACDDKILQAKNTAI